MLISAEQARWVREQRTVLAELPDGRIIVEITFKGIDFLVREVLKEAGDAIVLEPAEAREAVLAAAEGLIARSRRERCAATRSRCAPEELLRFLDEERTLTCATIGPDAWPHLMPLWYVVRDGECWAWTYAKSQKVRNLEREARCTIQVEAGLAYPELRGVMMKCVCAIHRDPEVVAGVGTELGARYGSGGVRGHAGAGLEAGGAAVHRQLHRFLGPPQALAGTQHAAPAVSRRYRRRSDASAPSRWRRRIASASSGSPLASAAPRSRCSSTIRALRSGVPVLTRAMRRWRSRSVS